MDYFVERELFGIPNLINKIVMMQRRGKILVNGREYGSLAQTPQLVKQLFSDQDGNGIPDIFEGKLGDIQFKNQGGMRTFVVGGNIYHNLKDMPPEARRKIDEAFQQFKNVPFSEIAKQVGRLTSKKLLGSWNGGEVDRTWIYLVLMFLVGGVVLSVGIFLLLFFFNQ